jgi:CheY-like chemotaxis protein
MSGEKRKIFVVNDEQAILTLFEELLEEEGYEVDVDNFRTSTESVFDRVLVAKPDMVIMDFLIGDEAMGWQLLQMMKLTRETKDIPVVVCSAAVKILRDLLPHLQTMKVQVVLKPFDIDHLLSVINTMWESPTAPLSFD